MKKMVIAKKNKKDFCHCAKLVVENWGERYFILTELNKLKRKGKKDTNFMKTSGFSH